MLIEKTKEIIDSIGKVLVGKREVVKKVLTAIYAGGNVLLEDLPGVGKTTLALSFAKVLGLGFKRIQCTPDTMPSDITGFSVYNKDTGELEYKAGPIFCNLFMADEVNRTSAKTQAALLEAMGETAVTIDGVTRLLPRPFFCIATQNPAGSAGTQPLPESQLDRFMVKLSIGYPSADEQVEILRRNHAVEPVKNLKCIMNKDELMSLQNNVSEITVVDDVLTYIVALCENIRKNPLVEVGISPRGLLALSKMARAYAVVEGRDYVVPSDVDYVFADVCEHRVVLRPRARLEGQSTRTILDDILKNTPKAPISK